jgi:hypothetical protein
MKLNYTPINTDTGKPLDDAALARMLRYWDGHWIFYGTQQVDAPNPEGNLRDFAIMLKAYHYTLSEELESMIPKPQKIPDGSVA